MFRPKRRHYVDSSANQIAAIALDYTNRLVKSAHEPSGQSGQRLSRFLIHEAIWSISTLAPSLDGILLHRRGSPSIKFVSAHLYTWVERGTVRVKCLAQEHNTMSPARARTRTAQSGDERNNYKATAPPRLFA